MKQTLIIIFALTLFSCKKETTESTTSTQSFAKIVNSVTSWHVNNNYNRRLTIQYTADTNLYKRIAVVEPGAEVYNGDITSNTGTITFIDHYSCLCDTYYTIFFIDANGNRTHIITELSKP